MIQRDTQGQDTDGALGNLSISPIGGARGEISPRASTLVWGGGQCGRDLRKISVPRIGGFGRVDGSRDAGEILHGFLPDVLGK